MVAGNGFSQAFQDTLRYAQVKEAILGTNTYNTFDIWKADNEAITQTFLLDGASITIKGIEFYGANDPAKGTASVTVRASIYSVDANYTPVTQLASGDVVISSSAYGYKYVFFNNPITVSSNYAVVLEAVSAKGVVSIYVNNAIPNQYYDELLTRFKSSYYAKSKGAYVSIPTLTTGDAASWPNGTYNFEALLAPLVSYELNSESTVSATSVCSNTPVECAGTSGPDTLLSNRMLNFQQFKKYFGKGSADSSFVWEMGDGSDYVYSKQHTHTYKTPGTYTATYYTCSGFWGSYIHQSVKTITAFINPAPAISKQPAATEVHEGGNASFSISSAEATSYRWQVKAGANFVDVQNGSLYSGANTKTLTVTGVTESMSGYIYRCVIKGECTVEGNSDQAQLTVKVGEPQSISFELAEELEYGTAAFKAGAVSSAGLQVSYSSSNTDVASIEDGMIHIKKAGETIITAMQEGNETYNAATPVTQNLIVTPGKITVLLKESPAIAKVYDKTTTASLVADNYVINGTVNNDEVTVTGTAQYADENVGADKHIYVKDFVLSGKDKGNYTLVTISDTVKGSIAPKAIGAMLKSKPSIEKVYDGNKMASLQEGNLEVSDIIEGDDVLLQGTAEYDNQQAGTAKTVYLKQLKLNGKDAGNYTLGETSELSATGTIKKKEITVAANHQTQVYGAGNAALTYTTTGLLDNDAMQGNLEKEPGKNVGLYNITAGTITGGNNYEIVSFSPATLTITPAPLTIAAENKTKKQGEQNPVFTFRYEGLVGGDTPEDLTALPQAHTTAATTSPIGNYPVTVSGAQSGNYTITMLTGMLTVAPEGKKQMKAWVSSPSELQVRIYAASVQKASIALYSATGKKIIVQQVQLNEGVNSYTIPVGNIMRGIYFVHMDAGKSAESQSIVIQ